ncbi:MAG: signal peptidase II [Firmicutes bacterium]|nr:signal peptidase II [Bacillota bacterium]
MGGVDIIYILLIIIIVIIDQFIKNLVKKELEGIYSKPIIKDFLHLTLVKNTGAAFSIFKNKQRLVLILNIISITFMFYVFLLFFKYNFVLINVAFAFMLGGALGNIIDRIRLRYVVDYLHIKFRKAPIFNIADIFIFLGSLLLIYTMIFEKYDLNI